MQSFKFFTVTSAVLHSKLLYSCVTLTISSATKCKITGYKNKHFNCFNSAYHVSKSRGYIPHWLLDQTVASTGKHHDVPKPEAWHLLPNCSELPRAPSEFTRGQQRHSSSVICGTTQDQTEQHSTFSLPISLFPHYEGWLYRDKCKPCLAPSSGSILLIIPNQTATEHLLSAARSVHNWSCSTRQDSSCSVLFLPLLFCFVVAVVIIIQILEDLPHACWERCIQELDVPFNAKVKDVIYSFCEMRLHSWVQSHLQEEQNCLKLEDRKARKHRFHSQYTLNADNIILCIRPSGTAH